MGARVTLLSSLPATTLVFNSSGPSLVWTIVTQPNLVSWGVGLSGLLYGAMGWVVVGTVDHSHSFTLNNTSHAPCQSVRTQGSLQLYNLFCYSSRIFFWAIDIYCIKASLPFFCWCPSMSPGRLFFLGFLWIAVEFARLPVRFIKYKTNFTPKNCLI